MLTVWMLMSSKGVLATTFFGKEGEAQRALVTEYPAGCRIYPNHRVVRVKLILDD